MFEDAASMLGRRLVFFEVDERAAILLLALSGRDFCARREAFGECGCLVERNVRATYVAAVSANC
jgi:hypothetical protein